MSNPLSAVTMIDPHSYNKKERIEIGEIHFDDGYEATYRVQLRTNGKRIRHTHVFLRNKGSGWPLSSKHRENLAGRAVAREHMIKKGWSK